MENIIETNVQENWLPIKGYQGNYEVSDQGRVRSLDRKVPTTNKKGNTFLCIKHGRVLKSSKTYTDIVQVNLCQNNEPFNMSVHRLVAFAFVPNNSPRAHNEVNHLNGIRTDNRATNLEWTNHQGNMRHASETGLLDDRENPQKINYEDAELIRVLYATGTTQLKLAKDYNLSQCHISNIVHFRTWITDTKQMK